MLLKVPIVNTKSDEGSAPLSASAIPTRHAANLNNISYGENADRIIVDFNTTIQDRQGASSQYQDPKLNKCFTDDPNFEYG